MLIILLFMLLLSFFEIIQCYDVQLSSVALNISQASYCIADKNIWDCFTCNNENTLEYYSLHKGEYSIYGYNIEYDSIFVAFRGSSNIQNWISNAKFTKVHPYSDYILIDKGFYEVFKSNKNTIYENINMISKKYNTKKIIITGHSLGGAIGTILSFDMMYNMFPYMINLITFGSPRVGNNEFVNLFNSYNIYSTRITHYYDIVPHLPQSLLNYKHIPQEIWYNEANSNYKICNDNFNEDDTCSNSCAPLKCKSVDDHENYMNIHMGINGYC